MVDLINGLGKVRNDDVSLISMFHGLREFLNKLKQLSFMWLHSSKTMLLRAQDTVCLVVVHEVTNNDVLKNLDGYASQRDCPVI